SAGRGLLTGNFGIEGILNEFHGGPSAGRELSSLEKNNIINYERQKQQVKLYEKQAKADKKKEKSSQDENNKSSEEDSNVYEIRANFNNKINLESPRVAAMTPVPVPVGAVRYSNGQHLSELQGLFDKIFGKRASNKLYSSMVPVPQVLLQLLSGDITLEQLLNRVPAIETAFAKAEKRTADALYDRNNPDKNLFLKYLEEELAAAGITEERAEKLLQTSKDYFAGQQLNISEEKIKKDPRGVLKETSKIVKENSANHEAYYLRAKAKAELKIYKSAIKDLDRAIAIEVANHKYYFERAWLKRFTEDYQGAKEDFDKAIELNKTADYLYNRAVIKQYFLKDYQGAIEDYQEALNLKPGTELYQLSMEEAQEALAEEQEKPARRKAKGKAPANISPEIIAKQKANKYFKKYKKTRDQGKVQEAYDNINEAIKYDPNNVEYRYDRAILEYYNFEKQSEAMADMQKAAELDPTNTRYKAVLNRWTEELEQETTKKDKTTQQKQINFVDGVKEQVFGKEKSNKLHAFILPLPKVLRQVLVGEITLEQLFNRTPAIKKAFENAEARTKQTLAEQNTSEAKGLFLSYLEEELAYANIAPEKATKLLQTATDYLKEKQQDSSISENTEKTTAPVDYKAPEKEVKVYDNMSVEDIIREDPKGLLKELSQVIKNDPNDDLAYYLRAKTKMELKIYKSAIKDLDRAIALNKAEHKYFYLRAWLKRLTSDYQGAKEDFDSAIELYKNADYLYNRGVIKAYYLKDYQGAVKDYQEALNLKPAHQLYQLSLEEAQEYLEEEAPAKPTTTTENNLLNKIGGIFMPIIMTKIVYPKAPKFTEKWSSFETMLPIDIAKELNKIDRKNLLVKDKYGKLPIEYALKNRNLVGYVKANDAFNYVYLYSNQVGLEANTIINEQTGATLAMIVLQQEDTTSPFGFIAAKV
ncbi:MAG: hypothetical protein IKP23_06255, partial [Elusimicrobiaceae bacterium]|nr:hypothetical protein [Elusimicrobiaceae bacterium]